MRPPRGSTRSRKYTVDQAEASEIAGIQAFILATGTDNDTLGQTAATDNAVPTGSKIMLLDLRAVFGNLVAINDFVYWSIQLRRSGQANLNPLSPGGSPLLKNIMLSGLFSIGKEQNKTLHIRYKIPKALQRVADGNIWAFVTNNGAVTTTAMQCVYKVFQ